LIEHNARNAMILAVELDQASTNPEIHRGLMNHGVQEAKRLNAARILRQPSVRA